MRKPDPAPTGPDADDSCDLREEIAVVNERDKDYREQREAGRPAGRLTKSWSGSFAVTPLLEPPGPHHASG